MTKHCNSSYRLRRGESRRTDVKDLTEIESINIPAKVVWVVLLLLSLRMSQNGLFTRILRGILRATVHSINQERYHYHRHFKSITKQTRWRQNQITFALARKEETLVSLDLNCLFLFYFSAFKHNEPFVLPSLSTCGCCCILKTGAYGVSLA